MTCWKDIDWCLGDVEQTCSCAIVGQSGQLIWNVKTLTGCYGRFRGQLQVAKDCWEGIGWLQSSRYFVQHIIWEILKFGELTKGWQHKYMALCNTKQKAHELCHTFCLYSTSFGLYSLSSQFMLVHQSWSGNAVLSGSI